MNSHDYEDLVREFHDRGLQVGLSIEEELDPTGPLMQRGKRITMSLDLRVSRVFSDDDIESMSKDFGGYILEELLEDLRDSARVALQLPNPGEEPEQSTDKGSPEKDDPQQDPDDFDAPEAPVGHEGFTERVAELLGLRKQEPQRSDLEVRLSTLSILMAQRSSAPTDAELQRVYNWVLGKETDDDRG